MWLQALLVTACGLLSSPVQEKKTLKEFERPFKSPPSRSADRSDKRQEDYPGRRRLEYDHEHDEEPGFWESLCGELAVGILAYPLSDHGLRFQDYPYQDGDASYFLSDRESDKFFSVELRTYALRAEHDLWAWGAAADFRLNTNLGLRADISQYRERTGGDLDTLELHEYEVNVSLGDGGRDVNVSLGMGLGILKGDETHGGVSFQAAAEGYLVSPLSFRVHTSAILFSNATLYDLSAELRVHWKRAALFVGVRSLLNSDGDDLTGPMIGLSIWF